MFFFDNATMRYNLYHINLSPIPNHQKEKNPKKSAVKVIVKMTIQTFQINVLMN